MSGCSSFLIRHMSVRFSVLVLFKDENSVCRDSKPGPFGLRVNALPTALIRFMSLVFNSHYRNCIIPTVMSWIWFWRDKQNISVLWLSINCTYLCVGRWQRRNICSHCWQSIPFNQITAMDIRVLSVVITTNLLLIC